MANASKPAISTQRCPSWRSRKVWLPILGIAALLVAGYIVTAQTGLGLG